MKQIAILGPGTVGGGVAEILMKNADTVAASAGEEIGLKYAVARREMPDCPCADKIVQDFSVIERDPEVWLVVETIGGAQHWAWCGGRSRPGSTWSRRTSS